MPTANETPEKEKLHQSQFLTLIEWQAEEYEYHEKSTDWYWSVGIISVGFFVLAVILRNVLFALLVLLAGFTLAIFGARKPKTISFSITSRGIKVGNRLYPFEDLKSFWINYDPPHVKELYIISKKILMPQLSIPMSAADPNEIREHLIKFLEEKEIPESFSDTISRFFRF